MAQAETLAAVETSCILGGAVLIFLIALRGVFMLKTKKMGWQSIDKFWFGPQKWGKQYRLLALSMAITLFLFAVPVITSYLFSVPVNAPTNLASVPERSVVVDDSAGSNERQGTYNKRSGEGQGEHTAKPIGERDNASPEAGLEKRAQNTAKENPAFIGAFFTGFGLALACLTLSIGALFFLVMGLFLSPEDELKEAFLASTDNNKMLRQLTVNGNMEKLEGELVKCYRALESLKNSSVQPRLVISCDSKLLDKNAVLPTTLLFINNQAAWYRDIPANLRGHILTPPDGSSVCPVQTALLKARDVLKQRIVANSDGAWLDTVNSPLHGIRFFIGKPEELVDQSDVFGRFLSGLNANWSAGILNVWLPESDWLEIHGKAVAKTVEDWWLNKRKMACRKSFLEICGEAKSALNHVTNSYLGKEPDSAVNRQAIETVLAKFNDVIPNRQNSLDRLDSPDFLMVGTSGVKGYDAELQDCGQLAFIAGLSYALFLLHHVKGRLIEPLIDTLMAVASTDPRARRQEKLLKLNKLVEASN